MLKADGPLPVAIPSSPNSIQSTRRIPQTITRMQLLRSVLLGLAVITSADATKCPVADTSIVAHTGKSVGRVEKHNGRKLTPDHWSQRKLTVIVDMYITKPTDCDARAHHKTGVIFFTDVFGIQLAQGRLYVSCCTLYMKPR